MIILTASIVLYCLLLLLLLLLLFYAERNFNELTQHVARRQSRVLYCAVSDHIHTYLLGGVEPLYAGMHTRTHTHKPLTNMCMCVCVHTSIKRVSMKQISPKQKRQQKHTKENT